MAPLAILSHSKILFFEILTLIQKKLNAVWTGEKKYIERMCMKVFESE